MYNSYFDESIRNRGFKYYKSGKVTDITENNNKVSALVTGTEPYYVEVVFNESNDRIIESAKCDCLYFKEKGYYCKHIYATILSVKYDEERERQENIEDEKVLENAKKECEKYIKLCEKAFEKNNRAIKANRKYLGKELYDDYTKWYNSYNNSFKSNIELVHKDSKYISFYQARLESFKRIYARLQENLEDLKKDVQKQTEYAYEAEKKQKKGILSGLVSLVAALMPDTKDDKNEELKVGDWVEITTEDEYGEILNIYDEGIDGLKYEVLFEKEIEGTDREQEDIDIFRRDELRKIKIE